MSGAAAAAAAGAAAAAARHHPPISPVGLLRKERKKIIPQPFGFDHCKSNMTFLLIRVKISAQVGKCIVITSKSQLLENAATYS